MQLDVLTRGQMGMPARAVENIGESRQLLAEDLSSGDPNAYHKVSVALLINAERRCHGLERFRRNLSS